MATKLTRLTHKIAIQVHLVAESCTICIFRFRRQVRKLLDTSSYHVCLTICYIPSIPLLRYCVKSSMHDCNYGACFSRPAI
jgi:hypothetical protein